MLPADMKISELTNRLRQLGLEKPTTIFEKAELVKFVEEAERQLSSSPADVASPATSQHLLRSPAAAKRTAATAEPLPKNWYKQESRSKPGKFYYVNSQSGATSWELPVSTGTPVSSGTPVAQAAPVEAKRVDATPEKSTKRFSLRDRPERGRKHDYRDDAFTQDEMIQDDLYPPELEDAPGPDVEDPLELSWSRDSIVTCEPGKGGVKALNVLAPGAPKTDPANSENTVKGGTFSWVRGEMIGRGALGRVFKALDQNTGQVLAVKEVLINDADTDDSKFKQDLENEVNILKGLKHPHIVAYLGHDYIDGCLYMYLEHMSGGTVTQALQQFGIFEEVLIADYSQQVLYGLEYLHTSDPPVVHRDIKGSNILLGLDCKAKLADFGCSRRTQQTLTHTMRGSVPWMAPEVIAFSRFGRSADIWSFGCFVIEMGTAHVPWGRFDNQMAALVKIGMSKALPPLPENVSQNCKDFITRCVQRDAELRPTATELLGDPIFKVGI